MMAILVIGKTRIANMMGESLVDTQMFVFPSLMKADMTPVVSYTLEDNAPFVEVAYR